MNGIILAAGMGTRLRPWTDNCPKALLKVNGKTMLDHAIENMEQAGVNKIIINVHHFADMMIRHIESNRSRYRSEIVISDERNRLLDTGAGIRQALALTDGNDTDHVIVTNADILTDFALKDMASRHMISGADITLLVDPNRQTRRKLLFDIHTQTMIGWMDCDKKLIRTPLHQTVDQTQWMQAAFGGIHVLSRKVLNLMNEYRSGDQTFGITDFYIDNCDKLCIKAYIADKPYRWLDIGKREVYDNLAH